MEPPREKPHRLPRERYLGEQTVAFTTCLENRYPLFVEERRPTEFAKILIEETERHECELVIACFMPDHLHVLAKGRTASSDALAAFYRFKLRTGIQLDRFCRPAKWQKDLYDHIARYGHDWRSQARYIAHNPLRAGLVEEPLEYPYIYSSMGDQKQVLYDIYWG